MDTNPNLRDYFDPNAAKRMKSGDYIALTSHPGLRLVATASRRSWIYRYKLAGTSQMKQLKLGQWPKLNFAEAVDAWQQARGARDEGQDLAAQRRDAKRAEILASATTNTVGHLVSRYLDEHVDANRKEKGAAEARRLLEQFTADVKDVPADKWTVTAAHEALHRIAKRAPRVAQMTRSELRAAWDFAVGSGRVAINPFHAPSFGAIPKRKVDEDSEERHLSDEEAGALLRWMREPRTYSRTVADALELTLRTGLRSGEVCGIRAEELHEREGVLWLDIPGKRMKMRKPHSVPLIGRARAIVEGRTVEGSPWLFPSRDGERAIEQKVLGVDVYAHSGSGSGKTYGHLRVCPVSDWSPHDLRRTARTMLAEMGCPYEIGEAILAHEVKGVAGRYNRAKHFAARVEWLMKLGKHLDTQ